MQRNKVKKYLFFIPLVLLHACIEEYRPDIEAVESSKYVVSGQLTTEQEDQIISVAIVSSVNDPNPIPLNDCKVKITDSFGNSFEGEEFEGGKYIIRIPVENIIAGRAYRLEIITPAGINLASEYEELLESPDVDSVYYIRENKPTNDPEVFIEGVQFYLNLDAPEMICGYYKFEVIETYEYHSQFPLVWYYDGILHHIDPPDYSHHICWATNQLSDIYILNTDELQSNTYKQYALHYVDNTSQRLEHMYSIIVKQYAISLREYVFWDQLRENNIEQGGMYEIQPLPVKGNLFNLTNPKQSVLGYFQVSSVKAKRIFVKDVPGLEFNYEPDCGTWPLEAPLRFYEPYRYPVYLTPSFGECDAPCIFCDSMIDGGTIIKPDFWPE